MFIFSEATCTWLNEQWMVVNVSWRREWSFAKPPQKISLAIDTSTDGWSVSAGLGFGRHDHRRRLAAAENSGQRAFEPLHFFVSDISCERILCIMTKRHEVQHQRCSAGFPAPGWDRRKASAIWLAENSKQFAPARFFLEDGKRPKDRNASNFTIGPLSLQPFYILNVYIQTIRYLADEPLSHYSQNESMDVCFTTW